MASEATFAKFRPAISELLCHRDVDGTQEHGLQFLRDNELVLQNEWERVRSTKDDRSLDRSLYRFLGFLEGRFRLSVPATWRHELLATARNLPDESVVFGQARTFTQPFSKATDAKHVLISPSFDLLSLGDGWHITRPVGEDVPIIGYDPVNNCIKINGQVESCLMLAVGDLGDLGIVVGFCANAPKPFLIVRIDPAGKLIWAARVNCRPELKSSSLGGSRSLETSCNVLCVDSIIWIFGATEGVGFIEGFELETGSTILRFSTK